MLNFANVSKERKGGNVRKILSEKIKSEDIKNIMVIVKRKELRREKERIRNCWH